MTDARSRWPFVVLPVYWVALATLTHYPRVQIPGEVPDGDKLAHFGAFGLLAFLFWQMLAARRPLSAASVWIAASILIPYATIDEYTQQFVGRYTDVADWVANVAGIACVLLALEVRRRVRACSTRRP
jgi:VanZ family protein